MPDKAAPTHAKEATHSQQPAAPGLEGGLPLLDDMTLLGIGVQRAFADPRGLSPAQVLALQRAAGNRAVSRLLAGAPLPPHAGVQPSPAGPPDLQAQATTGESVPAGPELEGRLGALKGGGSPLPGEVRAYMEPRFGADFGGVRVHTGPEAADLSGQVQAQAFTHGQDIYLNRGRYEPDTAAGRRLLAHELVHVVQQTGAAGPRVQRTLDPAVIAAVAGIRRPLKGTIRKTTLGKIIARLAEYEQARRDPAKEMAPLQKIIELCDRWQAENPSLTGDADWFKLEKLKVAAQFETTQSAEMVKSPEAMKVAGETARGEKKAFSYTLTAMGQAEKELYATPEERVRRLYQFFLALGAGTPSIHDFELVQGLLAGSGGLTTAYDAYVDKVNPAHAADYKMDKQLAKFETLSDWFGVAKSGKVRVQYMKKLAETGEVDPAYSMLLNLGQVSTGKTMDRYVVEAFEKCFEFDLLTKEPADAAKAGKTISGSLKEQVKEVKDGLDEFKKVLTTAGIPLPGTRGWTTHQAWHNVSPDVMARLQSTLAYFEAIVETGEKKGGGQDLTEADKAKLIKAAVRQVANIVGSLTGAVYITDTERGQMVDQVRDWKEKSVNLEKKLGLAPNSIGLAALGRAAPYDKQLTPLTIQLDFGGTSTNFGFHESDLGLLHDIVAGEVGRLETGKPVQVERKKPEEATALYIHQLIYQQVERADLRTRSSEDLAGKITDYVKKHDGAPLDYLLYLAGVKKAEFLAKTAAEKRTIIDGAMVTLETEMGKQNIQLRHVAKEFREQILALFRFGKDIEDQEGYVKLRQALTHVTFKNRAIYRAVMTLDETDRAMVRGDPQLCARLDEALKGDPTDKKKIETMLGFSLAAASTAANAPVYVGGKNVADEKVKDEDTLKGAPEPEDETDKAQTPNTYFDAACYPSGTAVPANTDFNYPVKIDRWAAIFSATGSSQTSVAASWESFKHESVTSQVARIGGGVLTVGISEALLRFFRPLESDAKSLRTVAYNAQDDILTAIKAESVKPDPDKAFKKITAEIAKKVPEGVRNHWDVDRWFAEGKALTFAQSWQLGERTGDEAYLLALVEEATPAELFTFFAEKDRLYELYAALNMEIDTAGKLRQAGQQDKAEEHLALAKELEAQLVSFVPGVKRSLVAQLEESTAVSSGTRRKVIAAIENELADGYQDEKDTQEKVNELRQKLAQMWTHTVGEGDKQKAEVEKLHLAGAQRPLTELEFKAASEIVHAERRLGETSARRGASLRGISGKKASMMEARATHVGAGRGVGALRVAESRGEAGSKEAYEAELAGRTRTMAETGQALEKKTASFLAMRDQVKAVVEGIVATLIAAIVAGATWGTGAWVGLAWLAAVVSAIIATVSTSIEKAIEFYFDPQAQTLKEAAYDVIAATLVAAMAGGVGTFIGGLDTEFFKGAWALRTLVREETSEAANAFLQGLVQVYIDATDKVLGATGKAITETIKQAITTGDGTKAAKDVLAEELGVEAIASSIAQSLMRGVINEGIYGGFMKSESLQARLGTEHDFEQDYMRHFSAFDFANYFAQQLAGDVTLAAIGKATAQLPGREGVGPTGGAFSQEAKVEKPGTEPEEHDEAQEEKKQDLLKTLKERVEQMATMKSEIGAILPLLDSVSVKNATELLSEVRDRMGEVDAVVTGFHADLAAASSAVGKSATVDGFKTTITADAQAIRDQMAAANAKLVARLSGRATELGGLVSQPVAPADLATQGAGELEVLWIHFNKLLLNAVDRQIEFDRDLPADVLDRIQELDPAQAAEIRRLREQMRADDKVIASCLAAVEAQLAARKTPPPQPSQHKPTRSSHAHHKPRYHKSGKPKTHHKTQGQT